MSERAAMKRRVRGLLRRQWLKPFGALALALLPLAAAAVAAVFLFRAASTDAPSLAAQVAELIAAASDVQTAALLLLGFAPDFTHLIACLPAVALLAGVYLFVWQPVCVSLSGYFLAFLRGKDPKATDAFGCFSGKYPRMLGGMLHRLLWQTVWILMALAAPIALYKGGLWLMDTFAQQLSLYSVYVLGALIVLCILWFVLFTLLLVNRLLAYSLTPVCIAAQPMLPARRATRLSRKLMRGYKWRLIGLYLSFANYFLPALLAGVLLIALPHAAGLLGLEEGVRATVRLALTILMAVNALAVVYVAPYASACFRAFYIERKREALLDEEVTPDDFTAPSKAGGAAPQGAQWKQPEDPTRTGG